MCCITSFARFTICGLIAMWLAGCGGGNGDSAMFAPPSSPAPTTPEISVNPVFTFLPAFNRPVSLKQAPGNDSSWFVAEKGGVIRVFANNVDSSSASVFLDISGVVDSSGEGGLLGFAFHQDFPLTPEVYVSYTRSGAPLVSYVSRFLSTDDGQTLNPGSEEVTETLAVFVNEPQDSDGDGLFDFEDNCIEVPNPTQCDSDGDLYGNHCDGDFNNSGFVNFGDLGLLKVGFFGTSEPTTMPTWSRTDR